MVYIKRKLNLVEESKKKSIFLFGPRQTGKTFLLKETFPDSFYYNLLLSDVFLKLTQRPQLIREELLANIDHINGPIIIDEIQKLPLLLDEVHFLIESYHLNFILTGSSSRKLTRGAANLLGGRARTRNLFPFVSAELDDFDLNKILNYGMIPSIYFSDEPSEDLIAYCGNYLQEEIVAEGIVRKIDNFSRFLQIASLMNTELINFESIASDAAIPSRTIREYFQILEDTLIGYALLPFKQTKKRKAISTSKFYFFDIGVSNTLAGRTNIKPKTDFFGKALEHFVFTELKAYLNYNKDKRELSFWRSKSGFEVDFLIGSNTAIEVKGTFLVQERHLKGLWALSEEKIFKNLLIISLDEEMRKIGNILVIPIKIFLKKLWNNEF